MAAKSAKKKYDLLMKKHKLPQLEELDACFELGNLEEEGNHLREIRRRIAEKLHDAISIAEQVLQPDTNLSELYESRVLDEEEKKRLFELYKKLMAAARKAAELSIVSNASQDAEFIKSIYPEWKSIAPELARFIRKLRAAWETDSEEGERAAYLG
ncbi:hypothetical protein HYU18_01055 [Candidatus Woesearchaeota archaeon]|nr:hypothetical protein [Candidatus Woesearchaeota archaeon]